MIPRLQQLSFFLVSAELLKDVPAFRKSQHAEIVMADTRLF